jgi:hypothetical protein
VAPRIPTGVTAVQLPDQSVRIAWTPPPGPEVPTGYLVHVLATGEDIEVPAGATTATLIAPAPRVRHSFTVQARYGATLAPPSDASPMIKTRPATPGAPPG